MSSFEMGGLASLHIYRESACGSFRRLKQDGNRFPIPSGRKLFTVQWRTRIYGIKDILNNHLTSEGGGGGYCGISHWYIQHICIMYMLRT